MDRSGIKPLGFSMDLFTIYLFQDLNGQDPIPLRYLCVSETSNLGGEGRKERVIFYPKFIKQLIKLNFGSMGRAELFIDPKTGLPESPYTVAGCVRRSTMKGLKIKPSQIGARVTTNHISIREEKTNIPWKKRKTLSG